MRQKWVINVMAAMLVVMIFLIMVSGLFRLLLLVLGVD